jgi:hypothetical protein
VNAATLADVATFLGVPLALVIFVVEKRRERRDREYGTYDALDEKYREYLLMCVEHPELNLYDIPLDEADPLDPEARVRRYAMFDILVSLLERAFLMYRDQSNSVKRRQWEGWVEYMRSYADNPTFVTLWDERGEGFDVDFVAFMTKIVTQVNSKKASVPADTAKSTEA